MDITFTTRATIDSVYADWVMVIITDDRHHNSGVPNVSIWIDGELCLKEGD